MVQFLQLLQHLDEKQELAQEECRMWNFWEKKFRNFRGCHTNHVCVIAKLPLRIPGLYESASMKWSSYEELGHK